MTDSSSEIGKEIAQKQKFEIAFQKLMEETSDELLKRWDRLIIWSEGIPLPYIQEDILRDLSDEKYGEYLLIVHKYRAGIL